MYRLYSTTDGYYNQGCVYDLIEAKKLKNELVNHIILGCKSHDENGFPIDEKEIN